MEHGFYKTIKINEKIEDAEEYLISIIKKELRIVLKKTDSFESSLTFNDCSKMCFFVKDEDKLYYCGPINIKNLKETKSGKNIWTFDYLIYFNHKPMIIQNISYVYDAVWNLSLPEEQIFNPYVVINYNDNFEVVRSREVYDVEKIKDYFVTSIESYDSYSIEGSSGQWDIYKVVCYEGGREIKAFSNIVTVEPSVLMPGEIAFKRQGDSVYTIYNLTHNSESKGDNYSETFYRKGELEDYKTLVTTTKDGRWTYKLNSDDKELFDKRIVGYTPQTYEFYFSVKNPIAEVVINDYFSKYAEVKQLPLNYEDDFSHNYRTVIKKEDKQACYFFLYLYKDKDISAPSSYGVEISQIYYYFKNNTYGVRDEEAVQYAIKMISNYDFIEPEKLIKKWMTLYPYKSIISPDEYFEYRHKDYRKECYYYVCEHIPELKKQYNKAIEELTEKGEINPRYKNEFSLYMITKSYFPSTVYQYRSEWLGAQSIDIYVPEEKLGIEYQGQQHYEPIELFGGEDGFENCKRRDEEKRVKCKENTVKLIEWSYEIEVEDKAFREMLKHNGIKAPNKKGY